jgi:hypothetical protein
MADKKPHTTEIIVTEQKVIHSGNKNGRDYTIYQVIATNRNGQLIDLNLRSFDELPKNQVIKVEVEKFDSEQYGVSYTVSLEGKKKSSGLGKVVDGLRDRVSALEARLEAVEKLVKGALSKHLQLKHHRQRNQRRRQPCQPRTVCRPTTFRSRGRGSSDFRSRHSGRRHLHLDRRVAGRLRVRVGLGEGHVAHPDARGGHRKAATGVPG